MADDDTQPQPPPTTPGYDPATLQRMIDQIQNPQPVPLPQGPSPSSHEGRGWLSLLGEALGGGEQYGTTAEREAGGIAALGAMGRRMLEASDYSYQPHTLGSIIGQGMGAAGEALGQRQAVTAAQQAANLDYQTKQQELQLSRLKEVLPLLKMQAGMATPNTLLGNAGKPNTSIGAVGGDTYEGAIGAHEGTGQNPNSTALGTGQFLASTWQDFARANPDLFKGMSPDQVLAARNNPALGTQAISWLAQQNADALTKAGVTPSGPALGIAHYLGAGAAAKVLQAPDNAPVAGFVSDAAVKANPELAKMTVAQLKQRYANTPAPAFLGGPKPGAAPPVVTAAATPPAGSAAPAQTAFVPGGNLPYGAPGPAPTTPGAPLVPPAAPTPRTATTLRGAGTPATPQLPGGNQQLSEGEPVPAPYRIAGTDTGPPASSFGIIGQAARAAEEGRPPPTPPATTTPPAVPTPQAASQAPPQPQAPPATVATPGGLTFEQFQQQHPLVIPDEERRTWTVQPPDLTDALAAKAEAARQLSLSRAGISGDPNKSLSDYNTAAQNVAKLQQDAQTKSLELQQASMQHARDTQRQLYDAEMQRQAAAAEAQRQRDAAVALKTQEGQQAIDLEKVKSGQTWHQKLEEQAAEYAQKNTIAPMAAAAQKAHQMNLGLAQMQALLPDLPKGGGPLGSVLEAHPDLAPLFNSAGILTDKSADAVRLVNGLVANISTEMKPTGLGALREYEWDAFKAQLPSMLSTPGGQQKAIALLMNMNDRIGAEHSWMSNYFSRKVPDELSPTPGATRSAHNLESDNPNESVQQRMDRELGPIIPRYAGPATGSGQAQWEASLPPGKPYYKTWAQPDPQHPGQPLRDSNGNIKTTRTLEIRPWQ